MPSKRIDGRIQHKRSIEADWIKATNFTPLPGEIIIYEAEDDSTNLSGTGRSTPIRYSRIKIGDGKTTVTNLPFSATQEENIYAANPDTLSRVIREAKPNSIVKLMSGTYEPLMLIGPDSYPENLTIVGGVPYNLDAHLPGVYISSGIPQSDYWRKSDLKASIFHKGLTFKGVCFTKDFKLRNCGMENLSIESCYFDGGACISVQPNTLDVAPYIEDPVKSTNNAKNYRYKHARTRVKNLRINKCRFVESAPTDASAIMAFEIDNATISENSFENHPYNAVQLGSYTGNERSTGIINITNNWVYGTQSRSFNIHWLKDAELYLLGNWIRRTNHSVIIRAQNCENTEYYFQDPTTGNYNLYSQDTTILFPSTFPPDDTEVTTVLFTDNKNLSETNGILVEKVIVPVDSAHKHTIDQISDLAAQLKNHHGSSAPADYESANSLSLPEGTVYIQYD